MISTKIHGILDYLMGLVLILLPFILELPEGAATWIPIILGAVTIIYSSMTDYELGVGRVLPMKAHLGIDLVAGLFFMASPWLFGFAEELWWPFVALGALEVVVSLLTDKRTEYVAGSGNF